jgi:hypothetical protein
LVETYQAEKELPNHHQNIPNGQNIQNGNQMVARFYKHNGKNTKKYYKWPQNIPNGRKIDQLDFKYTTIVHYKTLENLPKLEFLVLEYTIWQP